MLLLRLSKIHGLVSDCVLKFGQPGARRFAIRNECTSVCQKGVGITGFGQASVTRNSAVLFGPAPTIIFQCLLAGNLFSDVLNAITAVLRNRTFYVVPLVSL